MWAGDDAMQDGAEGPLFESTTSLLDDFDRDTTSPISTKQTEGAQENGSKTPLAVPGVVRTDHAMAYKNGDTGLPHDKAFSIQIGWRMFKLSGASLMSDAPSYFSTFFEEQMRQKGDSDEPVKILYIDRDPETFVDICRHLQGYYLAPRDGKHFVKLYADAQFYSLPRLMSLLFDTDHFVTVGGTDFQIPRDTFSGPGNSSNFFTLGFGGFMGGREDAFPGLESRGLMRPPPQVPQSVPNRDPDILQDLIRFARGYPLAIRNAKHRAALVSDCKYYGFKGLMHKLFACDISYNAERGSTEIVMQIEDLHKSGVSFFSDPLPSDSSPLGGWVHYARPFVDETSYEVIVEIGSAGQETKIDFRSMRAEFFGDTKARMASLFQTVADKMNLEPSLPLGLMMAAGGASAAPSSPANTPLSEDRVKIHIGSDAHITLDGSEHHLDQWSYASSGQSMDEDWTSMTTPQSPPQHLSPHQPMVQNYHSNTSAGGSVSSAGPQQPQQQQQQSQQPPPSKKRKRRGSMDEFGEWIVRRAQWRLRVQPKMESVGTTRRSDAGFEVVLWAVQIQAFSGQRGRNAGRGWVS